MKSYPVKFKKSKNKSYESIFEKRENHNNKVARVNCN